jgi:hypothetical protein
MNILNRIKNKVFKSNISINVDYHAGAFFIKKNVAYLIFGNDDSVILYYREEGLHPYDNDYEKLLDDLATKKENQAYAICQPNLENNLLKLTNNEKEILCMPSIFLENVNEDELTELLLDKLNGQRHIFTLVYVINKHT